MLGRDHSHRLSSGFLSLEVDNRPYSPLLIMEALFQINSKLFELLPSGAQGVVKTLPLPGYSLLLVLLLVTLACLVPLLIGGNKSESKEDLEKAAEEKERIKQAKLKEFREKRKLQKAMKRKEVEEVKENPIQKPAPVKARSPSPEPVPEPPKVHAPASIPAPVAASPPSEEVSKPAPKDKKKKKQPQEAKQPAEERKEVVRKEVVEVKQEPAPVVPVDADFQEAKGKKKTGKGKKPAAAKTEPAVPEQVSAQAVETADEWQEQVSRKAKRSARK